EILPVPERLGVIGATGHGSLVHTAAFVENMIRNREAEPQPANFIYSVHNAASTQVALSLQARGYNLTITHDHNCFEQALQAAARRLSAGCEDRLLVLGADEYQPVMYAAQKRFGFWRRRRGKALFPGEGAAAMWLGPATPDRPLVADVQWDVAAVLGSPAEEAARLTRALEAVQLTWTQVSQVLVGLSPADEFTPAVFSEWRTATGRSLTPYLEHTGFFPTASATALVLGAVQAEADSGKKKNNQDRNAVLLYNRSQVETRSWVILKI
ncbi:MAG: hypothetical protein HGA76_06635, partial [Candidatus Firestonebacteria bacterium]|nr:hypothetical protein [Candidatus Firestonebacteria bacterium]